jgi:hypothetical protein
MEKVKEASNHSLNAERETSDMRLCLTIEDCAVTLNFPSKPQDSIITEIKRMMLSGQSNIRK